MSAVHADGIRAELKKDRYIFAPLSQRTAGSVVHFASAIYSSKHAVEGITKSVAVEVADSGIRVNAVAPGPTDTGMLTRFTGTAENKALLVKGVPLGRLGLSEELASAIAFIGSDEASFITSHVFNVDGGQSIL